MLHKYTDLTSSILQWSWDIEAAVPTFMVLSLPLCGLEKKHPFRGLDQDTFNSKILQFFLWHQTIQCLWKMCFQRWFDLRNFCFASWSVKSFWSKSLFPFIKERIRELQRLGRTHISHSDFSQCSEGKKLRLIYISSFSKEKDDVPCALFTHWGLR